MSRFAKIKLPYSSAVHTGKIDQAIVWCSEKFGKSFYSLETGDRRWSYIGIGEFEFLNEEDAILFALRWA
jgi:hypothetical protein